MAQNNELKRRLLLLSPDAVVKPPTRNLSTWDFYLKTNIAAEWQDCRKWIEICKIISDLPPKFHKGAIITLKGMRKTKVKDVFRVCGMKDLIALVGPGLRRTGSPRTHGRTGSPSETEVAL
jgi:hypothetical protein